MPSKAVYILIQFISLLNFNIYKKNSQYYTGKFKNFNLFVIIR